MPRVWATLPTYFHEYLIPTPLMRKFAVQLILVLHFAHASNIRQPNIMIKFQDISLIKSEFPIDHPTPTQNRTKAKYTPILNRSVIPPVGYHKLRDHLAKILNHFGCFSKELLAQGDAETVNSIFEGEGRIKGVKSTGVPPLEHENGGADCGGMR
ncbi:hypothetical protein QC761_206977 [Podospora bellae-mahoneyi]|uniref:Uncharacterized protein n=1 Tax=Podospora bellae-mahoneyi TaxID=2093777 RepID=A0ABR0FSW7_9PEZI|nr:hypothetical protein QC761_206977 [Podospora bellae-mahoneyi]